LYQFFPRDPRYRGFKNNNNNNKIYKAPKALASEALAAGQSWVLLKSIMEEVLTASQR